MEDPITDTPTTAKQLAAPVASVEVLVECNTPAQIVDEVDGAVYGKTGEPFVLERSEEPVTLLVRADGYEDGIVAVVPNEDRKIRHELHKTIVRDTSEDPFGDIPPESQEQIELPKIKDPKGPKAPEIHKKTRPTKKPKAQQKMDILDDDLAEIQKQLEQYDKKG